MKKRIIVSGFMTMLLTLLVVSPTYALPYTKLTSDASKDNQPVSAYSADNSYWAPCRTQRDLGDLQCYGAWQRVLQLGDVAVHMADGYTWNNPVVPFGSMVDVGQNKTISLRYSDGSYYTSHIFWVADTGGNDFGEDYWIDIYCGDPYPSSPQRNDYAGKDKANETAVVTAFGSSPGNTKRFTLFFNVPPIF